MRLPDRYQTRLTYAVAACLSAACVWAVVMYLYGRGLAELDPWAMALAVGVPFVVALLSFPAKGRSGEDMVFCGLWVVLSSFRAYGLLAYGVPAFADAFAQGGLLLALGTSLSTLFAIALFIFVGTVAMAGLPWWVALGVSALLVSSDQGLSVRADALNRFVDGGGTGTPSDMP